MLPAGRKQKFPLWRKNEGRLPLGYFGEDPRDKMFCWTVLEKSGFPRSGVLSTGLPCSIVGSLGLSFPKGPGYLCIGSTCREGHLQVGRGFDLTEWKPPQE